MKKNEKILNVNKVKVKFNGVWINFNVVWINFNVVWINFNVVWIIFDECDFFYVKGLPCPKKEENLSSTCFLI